MKEYIYHIKVVNPEGQIMGMRFSFTDQNKNQVIAEKIQELLAAVDINPESLHISFVGVKE